MKSTGIIRRIDDLGRVVIPKEIRRRLRIRSGESLEVFIDNEKIALKKYSSMRSFKEIAQSITESVNQTVQKNVLIADRDTFIAIAGDLKKELLGKTISSFLEQMIMDRKTIIEKDVTYLQITKEVQKKVSYYICPIIMSGDCIGLIAILSSKDSITDIDKKLAIVCAQFLSKYIEQ